jgi:hypothetical protein
MRLRFTIRDLLWLTLVVAVAVGWRLNNRRHFEPIKTLPPSSMLLPLCKADRV